MNSQEIIDKLTGNENPCQCECGCGNCCCWQPPVYIGNVLEHIVKMENDNEYIQKFKGILGEPEFKMNLLVAWKDCGYDKSLQEIAEMKEETAICEFCKKNWDEHGACECNDNETEPSFLSQLKPEAQELFNFLEKIL